MSLPAYRLAIYRPGRGSRLDDLLSRYQTAHPELSAKSVKQLAICLSMVRRWGGPDIGCDGIFSLDHFEDFTAWLMREPKHRGTEPGKPRSIRTVKGKRDSLWTLWRFAAKRQLCEMPPPDRDDLARLKVPKEDPIAWSPDEVKRIIEQARRAPEIGCWKPAHWISFISAIWYSSERFDALLSCRFDDLEGDRLLVRACRTKDKKAGCYQLPQWLVDLIHSLPLLAGTVPEEKRELIWPYPFKRDSMRFHYRMDILRPAGLPDDRHHLFHCLRRSTLTEMVNVAGVAAAQEMARHSSPSITLSCYVSQAKLRRTATPAELLPNPAETG